MNSRKKIIYIYIFVYVYVFLSSSKQFKVVSGDAVSGKLAVWEKT